MKWVVGALLLLALGMTLQLGLLVYAMYVLLGVIAISRFFARNWTENISAVREVSRTVCETGEKIAVAVHLRNAGRLPVVWLLIEDSLPLSAVRTKPAKIKLKGKRHALFSLGGNAEKSLLYQATLNYHGHYQIGPLLIESGDLFGLHRRWRVLTAPVYVLVFPKVIPISGYDIASRRPVGEVRMVHRLFEDPTRINGIRPYQRGDSLNRIHWKATARTGELHSKTYEPSTVAGMSIVLDYHKQHYTDRNEPFRSELAVTTAASLAHAVSVIGQQVGIYSNGRDAADRVRTEGYRHDFVSREIAHQEVREESVSDRLRPVSVETRRAADQFAKIHETLARLELTDGISFPQLLSEVRPRLPRDATVLAILPFVSEGSAIALGSLRQSGFAVTVVLLMWDDEIEYHNCAGRLIAQNIDVRRIQNEEELAMLCDRRHAGLMV